MRGASNRFSSIVRGVGGGAEEDFDAAVAALSRARRILVLGSPGSGKSYFAACLARRTGLPLVRLDDLYWGPGWERPSPAVFAADVSSAVASESWIIDGNYADTLSLRLHRADWVVLLDIAPWRCLARVARRGVTRALAGGECLPARVRAPRAPRRRALVDVGFLRLIASFRHRMLPRMAATLACSAGTSYVVLSGARQAESFIERLGGAAG